MVHSKCVWSHAPTLTGQNCFRDRRPEPTFLTRRQHLGVNSDECLSVCACMGVLVYVCVHVCVMRVCLCACVCMCVRMYACMYVCTGSAS